MVIDFHTHSLLSDGVLLPAELARRYEAAGYDIVAITDHADSSNLDFVVQRIVQFAREYNKKSKIKVIAGVELTHIIPSQIKKLVKKSRDLGAGLVLVHGETIVEPVTRGTNKAAILAGCDILTHPGLITEQDAQLAKKHGVCLEISARKGHCLSNGHVANTAKNTGAALVYGTDFHAPADLAGPAHIQNVLKAAGLLPGQITQVFNNMSKLAASV